MPQLRSTAIPEQLWLYATEPTPRRYTARPKETNSLNDFKDPRAVTRLLKQVDWAFEKEKTGYLGHDLHPYPAKFIPQIPGTLIALLSLRGELVWDPFGGSGTTALEALLLSRRAVSTDANPIATLICRAKCTALSPEDRKELHALQARIAAVVDAADPDASIAAAWNDEAHQIPSIPNLESWYAPNVVKALCFLKASIQDVPGQPARDLALVVFSSILIRTSFQDSETRYARREKRIPTDYVLSTYCEAVTGAIAAHEPLERLLGYRTASAVTCDMRDPAVAEQSGITSESVDLVVTSPPYANATDYHLYHRFRLFWLGFNPGVLAQQEIGSHLRHQRLKAGFELYVAEMRKSLSRIAYALRPGRYAALVVGDSVFDGKTKDTAQVLSGEAEAEHLETVAVLTRPVHATRRSFIPAARRARSEKILILRKPPRRLRLTFGTPYRLWPYEELLKQEELKAVARVRTQPRPGDPPVATLGCYDVSPLRRLAFSHVVEDRDGHATWKTWQAILENGVASRSQRKDPKYFTHGIHPYKGKFYPQLAKALFNIGKLRPGDSVLDPFCGSGTVLLEAQLNGLSAVGCDMNPLAVLISRAKTAIALENETVLDRLLSDFCDRILSAPCDDRYLSTFPEPLLPEILRWFPHRVACRIGWLLAQIRKLPNEAAQLLLQVLLSSIVRQVSQQEPADLRIRRRKTAMVDAPVIELLTARIEACRSRLRHFAHCRSWAPWTFGQVDVRAGDSRDVDSIEAPNGALFDGVVTSPPYATALPYIDTDRLSLLTILGIPSARRAELESTLAGSREIRDRERRRLEVEIRAADLPVALGSATAADVVRRVYELNSASDVGFRRRNLAALLLRYFSDMHRILGNVARVVRPSAHLFFVIGDNRTIAGGKEVAIPSTRVLMEIGATCGWHLAQTIPITVTKEAVLHSHNSITRNSILHFVACERIAIGRRPARGRLSDLRRGAESTQR